MEERIQSGFALSLLEDATWEAVRQEKEKELGCEVVLVPPRETKEA